MVMGLAGQEAEVVSSRGSAGQGTVGGAGETERNIQVCYRLFARAIVML